MDDIAHIDAGHTKQRELKGFNRQNRNLHHEESWLAEGPTVPGAKKWPVSDAEIRAFQTANPPLVVDGMIGKKTLARLTQLGYTPPTGFKPIADKTTTLSTIAKDTQPDQNSPTGTVLGPAFNGSNAQDIIDANTPKSGDFSGQVGKGNKMPPNEMPPGAKPFKNNPEVQYVYNGLVYDLASGYPLSDDSPMLAPGEKEREEARNTDAFGNKRGSYKIMDVVPVVAKPGLAQGNTPNEMDRIQKAFGRDFKLGSSWDFKGAAISIWYRPEGGQGRMYHDFSKLEAVMGDWEGAFKQIGYKLIKMNDLGKISNSLGNAVAEEFSLVNSQGQQLHGAGTAQQVAFTTADGTKGYSTIDVSFLGSEQSWRSGGEEAWKNTYQSLTLAPGLQGLQKIQRKLPSNFNPNDGRQY